MLDTGIDVPEIVNLVFYKPIRSSSKFWQMIGRGTRLCKNLFAPDQDKENFIIFDFCENFEFFGNKPKGLDGKRGRSLTERLFQQRIKLTYHLQKNGSKEALEYAEELKDFMLEQVNRLEEDSFLVRQHWRIVEKYRDKYKWNALDELEVKEVLDNIAPLVFEEGDDEQAKRFDQLCYNMELDLLQKTLISDQWMNETISIVAALSKKGAIPMVANKMDLIKQIQTAQYWQDMNLVKVEHTRKELRSLIRFIDKSSGITLYSNFEDEVLSATSEPKPVIVSGNLEAYRKRMAEFVLKNRTHITIHKLSTNQIITKTELKELDRMLFEQGENGTHEQFIKAYGEMPLGKFIRTIVGLEQEAVNKAFSSFINNPSLNAAQIRFVNLIIQYLSTNGIVEVEKLFEPPFTEISNQGLLGVFNQVQAAEVVELINKVNHLAEAV
jgi:type I restriction enzyme R subunit